jgi:nitronate monooxygenase
MKTRITQLFGIKYPILCGGIYRLANPKLCAAISNAGGLGNITAAWYRTKEEFITAIREVKELTDKPFWVNVTLLPAMDVSDEQYNFYFDTIAAEKITAVEISGTPLSRFAGGENIPKLKDAGVKLVHKVGSVRHAQHVEKVGYDAVLAAGVEEGGHPLSGMADGKGLAAALCLGAEGIMMASRFICTHECEVHDNVQQELIRRQENETVLYGNSIGLQGRALANETMMKVLEIEDRKGGLDEILPLIAGSHGDEIWEKGNMNIGSINVGQSIGLIHDVVSCQELLDRIVIEAEEILNRVKGKF